MVRQVLFAAVIALASSAVTVPAVPAEMDAQAPVISGADCKMKSEPVQLNTNCRFTT